MKKSDVQLLFSIIMSRNLRCLINHFILHRGPPSTGKTQWLIDKIVHLHKEKGPFSYLWLGPSGGAIRLVREKVLDYTEGLYPENFRVIDQFTVEQLRLLICDRHFVDREFLSALITDVVSDNTALFELIKRGRGMLQQFVDFFFLLLEQKDIEAVRAEIDASDDHALKDFLGLFDKVEQLLRSLRVYTIIHGYQQLSSLLIEEKTWFSQRFAQVDTLIIDGFLDIPHSIQELLLQLLLFFSNVHLTLPLDTQGDWIDTSWERLMLALKTHFPSVRYSEQNYAFDPKKATHVSLFCGDLLNDHHHPTLTPSDRFNCIQTHYFESPAEEVVWICCQIKDWLTAKDQTQQIDPEEIGIVLRNAGLYEPLFTSTMDDMGIPWRSDTHVPLLESVNIHRIILPFLVFSRGFPPDLLLLIMESGLIPLMSLSSGELERIARGAGLYHSPFFSGITKDYPKGFKQRKTEWTEKMQHYRTFVLNRLSAAAHSEDHDELVEAIQQELDHVDQVIASVESLFDLLAPSFGRIAQMSVQEYERTFLGFLESLQESGMLSETASEKAATQMLFDDLFPKVARLCHIAHQKSHGKVNPVKFWFYLRAYLEETQMPSSQKMDNRVRLMDLESSRFRQHAIRFYPGMTHQSYPQILFHSLLFQDTLLGKDQRQRMLERDHRDFWSSVRQSSEKVFFSCPLGDTTGNPYTPSFYFDHIQRQLHGKVPRPPCPTGNEASWAYSMRSFLLHLLKEHPQPQLIPQSPIWKTFPAQADFASAMEMVDAMHLASKSQYTVDVSVPIYRNSLMKLLGNTMSPTRYTSLKDCPAKFLWQHILRVRARIETTLGFDPMQEGLILHATLKAALEKITQTEQKMIQNMTLAQRVAFTEKPLEQMVHQEVASRIFNPYPIIQQVEVDYFHRLLSDFLMRCGDSRVFSPAGAHDSPYEDVSFIPSQFEVMIRASDQILLSKDPPLYLTGKIDRIDQAESGIEFLVDYKRKDSANLDIDQLLLYTYARNSIRGGQTVAGMAFMPIISDSDSSNTLKKLHVWIDEEDAFLPYQANGRRNTRSPAIHMNAFIEELQDRVQKMAQGNFHPDKPNCYFCDFHTHGLCHLRSHAGKERSP